MASNDEAPVNRITTFPFTYLPPSLVHLAYVAGGFAVDAERASDVDLWITGLNNEEIVKDVYKEHILDNLNSGWGGPSPWSFIDPHDPYEIGGVKRIGTLWNSDIEGSYKVQVLVTTLVTVEELLHTFDLSVHQVAYNAEGKLFRVPSTTTPGVTPVRVTRWDTPHSTLRRYFKLTERYESAIEWQDIEQLCSLAISSSYKGKWPGKKAE